VKTIPKPTSYDHLEVVVDEDTRQDSDTEVPIRLELGPAVRTIVEVDGDELPSEVSGGEADGHGPVSPAEPNANASVCEGSHDRAGEDGEDALDVVTEEKSGALDAGLLVVLAVLAGVDGVVVDGPANEYNES
jgi:hypothetical protein